MILYENEEEAKPTYPYIGMCSGNELIVLFTAEDTGFVLESGVYDLYQTGEFGRNWEESSFRPYTEKVVLQNEREG